MKIVSLKKTNIIKRVVGINVRDVHHYILENGIISGNSGGGGLKFAADQIAMISKRKEKVGDEVVGNVVHVKLFKSRITKENKMVDVLITYQGGLSRYYGLLDMAERYGIFKKVSTRYELPDGSKQFGTAIYKDPERFFTKEVLEKINEGVKKEYSYGIEGDTSSEEIKELSEETVEDNA